MALHRLQEYPAIPGPSDKQEYALLIEGIQTHPSQYTSITFPPSYFAKYGIAINYYRAFDALMRAEPNRVLCPKYKIDFIQIAQRISFAQFAKLSDCIADQKELRPLDRRLLEAAYVQEVFFKYDQMMQDIPAAQQMYGKPDEKKFRSWAQHWLKEATDKRFKCTGLEDYWAAKKLAYPDMDVELLEDDAYEPVESEEVNTVTDNEMRDAEMGVETETQAPDLTVKSDSDMEGMDVDTVEDNQVASSFQVVIRPRA